MSGHSSLNNAKKAKNDEFYTQLSDVSEELRHYREHFRGKVIFCNCDDPTWSAFWRYFHLNFEFLGLKKLISTHYDKNKSTYKMIYTGGDDNDIEVGEKIPLEGNGDFRNQECLELLDEADIVVTNPPFSLARQYIAVLENHYKKYIIIGDLNWITYKEIFPLIKENHLWLGYNPVKEFRQPDGTFKKFGNKLWFTNLDIKKRHEKLILWKKYNPTDFPAYDNYDAINVDKVCDIPIDYCESWELTMEEYDRLVKDQWEVVRHGFRKEDTVFVIPAKDTELRKLLHDHSDSYKEKIEAALGKALYASGAMGVPITFLDKYNPEQFEIENPADYVKTSLTDAVNCADAPTDRQTDRQAFLRREQTAGMYTANGSMLASLSGRYCNGIIGVPITFLDKYNPEEFRIIGLDRYVPDNPRYGHRFTITGHETYARILVKSVL